MADFDPFTGNNYGITNESSVYPAKVFFAQGCEPEPEPEEETDAEIEDGEPETQVTVKE